MLRQIVHGNAAGHSIGDRIGGAAGRTRAVADAAGAVVDQCAVAPEHIAADSGKKRSA